LFITEVIGYSFDQNSEKSAKSTKKLKIFCVIIQYNTNQIYNARKVTPKCESEARK